MNNQQNFSHRGAPKQYGPGPGGPPRQMMPPGGSMMGPGMGGRPNNMMPQPHYQNNFGMQNQNMMNNGPPAPEQPQKLKIELTNKERGYYSNMLSKVETDGSSRVEGKTAVNFFKKSGVDVNLLRGIWKT